MRYFLLILLLSSILLSGSYGCGQWGPVYVSGKIIDGKHRVEGANIYVYSDQEQNIKDVLKGNPVTVSNIIGTFEFRFTCHFRYSENYYIHIYKEGYKPYREKIVNLKTIKGGFVPGRFNIRILNSFKLEKEAEN